MKNRRTGEKIDISVVIPVYGCRAAIPELHRRLCESLEKISKAFEIILVDDYCPQNSWEEIQKVCEKIKGLLEFIWLATLGKFVQLQQD